MKKNKAGFTLIELLVVIAIIGLLSSITMASLSDAKKKASDGNIKVQLNHIRTQASNFYTIGNTYEGLCANTSLGILAMTTAAAKQAGATSVGTDTNAWNYTTMPAVCHDTASGWAVIVSLKKPVTPSRGWCVDSTLIAKEVGVLSYSAGPPTVSSVVCGI